MIVRVHSAGLLLPLTVFLQRVRGIAAGAGYCQRVVVVVGHGFGWGQSVPSYRGWGFAGTWWMFTGCFGVGCMASVHTARAVQLHLSMDGQYKLGCYGSYVSECGGW